VNINSSLITELKDKQYRDAYVASQIRISLPLQTRALRKSREWTQPELAEHAGMAQPRISEIEKPGERRLNIETLLRLASAFDVALQVRFVPFSQLIDFSEDLDLDTFAIEPFTEELKKEEAAQEEAAQKVAIMMLAESVNPASAGRTNQLLPLPDTLTSDGNHKKQPMSEHNPIFIRGALANAAISGNSR
jgi:transcriptional regulator with XRE-family HTH domain